MNKNKLIKIIEEIAPLSLQEDWDNSGWQINTGKENVEKVLVTMEITSSVIEEAVSKEADLIISHHPLFFNPIKKIDRKDITGKLALKLIEYGIDVYSSHTPFDIAEEGNNDYLGEILEIKDVTTMVGDSLKMGRMGYLKKKNMNVRTFIDFASDRLKVRKQFFSFSGDVEKKIEKVGWCTGAGASFMELAFANRCDLFITGDVKYHSAQNGRELGIPILDLGHFATEYIFRDNMARLIVHKLDNSDKVDIIKSQVDLNPFVEI